jgi:hypothetical protein
MQRIHYVYLLTRALPEGGCRYYVGIRTAPKGKTPETDTKYMGSGHRIRRAVKAHPGEFTKTIVDVFETRAEAKAMERALVGLATANSKWSYNLREGGQDHGLHSEESKARMRTAWLARSEESEARRLERIREVQQTEEYRRVHAEGTRRRSEDPAWQEAQAERNRALATDPAWQEANAAANRAKAQTSEWLEANAAPHRTPEGRKANSERNKRRFDEDPAALRALIESGLAPEARKKAGATNKRRCAAMTADERRAMISKAATEAAKSPEARKKNSAGNISWWATATDEQKTARLAGLRRASERGRAEHAA